MKYDHEFDGEAFRSVAEAHKEVAEPSNLTASDGHPEGADEAALSQPSARGTLSDTIDSIRANHRERNFAMEQRKRVDQSLGAHIRTMTGWRKELPEADRKKIESGAAMLVECGEALANGKEHFLWDSDDYHRFESIIAASIAARDPWESVEKVATKEMERLARTLPVWNAWGKDVRGFGARSLAVIVGEAGDLSNYPKKGHLWKRMGLAVMGDGTGTADIRQGGLRKSASSDDWIAHGYSAHRRAQVWVIGDSLVKQGALYRKIYLARKDYERASATASGLTVAPSAKIPKSRAAEFISDGHIHKRAQRYMEKRLLKDLWQAWRSATSRVSKDQLWNATAEIPQERTQNGCEAALAAPMKAELALPNAQPNERKAIQCLPRHAAKRRMPTAQPLAAE